MKVFFGSNCSQGCLHSYYSGCNYKPKCTISSTSLLPLGAHKAQTADTLTLATHYAIESSSTTLPRPPLVATAALNALAKDLYTRSTSIPTSFAMALNEVEDAAKFICNVSSKTVQGLEITSTVEPALRRGRGRPRKGGSANKQQDVELVEAMATLIASSCTAFSSLPATFERPENLARVLFGLHALSSRAASLLAKLGCNTADVTGALQSGLSTVFGSAPPGCLKSHNTTHSGYVAGGPTAISAPMHTAAHTASTAAPGSVDGALNSAQGAGGPSTAGFEGATHTASDTVTGSGNAVRARVPRHAATEGANRLNTGTGNSIGARAPSYTASGLKGPNTGASDRAGLDEIIDGAVGRAVLAVEEGQLVEFCQAAWVLLQPGMVGYWTLEQQMDGAAAFLQYMATACSSSKTDGSAGHSSTKHCNSNNNGKAGHSSSSSSSAVIPTGKSSNTPHASNDTTASSQFTSTTCSSVPGSEKPHGTSTSTALTGLRTLPSSLFALPPGLLRDLEDPGARELWLRVCCDTFGAPMHKHKSEQLRALAAQLRATGAASPRQGSVAAAGGGSTAGARSASAASSSLSAPSKGYTEPGTSTAAATAAAGLGYAPPASNRVITEGGQKQELVGGRGKRGRQRVREKRDKALGFDSKRSKEGATVAGNSGTLNQDLVSSSNGGRAAMKGSGLGGDWGREHSTTQGELSLRGSTGRKEGVGCGENGAITEGMRVSGRGRVSGSISDSSDSESEEQEGSGPVREGVCGAHASSVIDSSSSSSSNNENDMNSVGSSISSGSNNDTVGSSIVGSSSNRSVGVNHGAAARRLVLATAAFNRCCRAGLRHRDCFVVTQAWVDAVVAPALRSLRRSTLAGNVVVLARLVYMAASALGMCSNASVARHGRCSSGFGRTTGSTGTSTSTSTSSKSSGGSKGSSSNSEGRNSSCGGQATCSSYGGNACSDSQRSSNAHGGVDGRSDDGTCRSRDQAPVPAHTNSAIGVPLIELQALLGALRELQGSSSWVVPADALASLDEALVAEGACSLQDKEQGAAAALHLPPRLTPPPAHLLASSSGMLKLVFAMDAQQLQQDQGCGGRDAQQPNADCTESSLAAKQPHSPSTTTPSPLDHTPNPRSANPVLQDSSDQVPTASGTPSLAPDRNMASDQVPTASHHLPAVAASSRATAVVQLLKARSTLGRGTQSLPSAPLMSIASGAVMEAADRVTRANIESRVASTSNGSPAEAPRTSAQPLRAEHVNPELDMVTALQDLLGLLADQQHLLLEQQLLQEEEQHIQLHAMQQQQKQQQQYQDQEVPRHKHHHHVQNHQYDQNQHGQNQHEQHQHSQNQSLSLLSSRIDALMNKLYMCLALLPDRAWGDAVFLSSTYPRMLQLCVGRLKQRSDLLQPDRWVLSSLSLMLHAPTPALNVDAFVGLVQGARTLPFDLLLEPHDPLLMHTQHSTHRIGQDAAASGGAPDHACTWWSALDAAIAQTVGTAATVAFLRPHWWLKLLRFLTEEVEGSNQSRGIAGGVEFPATAHAVGLAAASNPALFGGFGRRKQPLPSSSSINHGVSGATAGQGDEAPLFGGAANLNGEVGALLPRLCVRKAELIGSEGLDWLQLRVRGVV